MMSGIGHLALGFAAKPATQKVPLWVLLAASEKNDVLFVVFSTIGLEKKAAFTMSFSQGVRYMVPGSNPWSHGLMMTMIWSILIAAIGLRIYKDRRSAGILGLVVLSHWGLDFLMHANLPLFLSGPPFVGLGLENTGPGFLFMTILDLVLLAAGVGIYFIDRKRTITLQPEKKVESN